MKMEKPPPGSACKMASLWPDFTITRTFWKEKIKLIGGVKNLLDIQQVNVSGISGGAHTGSEGIAPIGTGRNFFIRASIKLGW